MNKALFHILLPLSLAVSAPAFAAPAPAAGFETILQGRNTPLRITASQLNSDYRRLSVGADSDFMDMKMQQLAATTGIEFGVYYTRGEIVTVGNESYLIAYRPDIPIDPNALNFHAHSHGPDDDAGNGGVPVPAKLAPRTPLVLSLLNLRTTASLNDIRAFDAKVDLQTPQESLAVSNRTLTTLGRNMLTWIASRNNGRLPQFNSVVTELNRRSMYPIVHDQRLWVNPVTDEAYMFNGSLANSDFRTIINKQKLPMMYEAKAADDGTRGVLFLDGRVVRVKESEWAGILATTPIRKAGAGGRAPAAGMSAAAPKDRERETGDETE